MTTATAAVSRSQAPHFKGDPVVLGQEVCESGYLAGADGYLVPGAQLAVKLINQSGGVLGHKLVLQTLDTQCIATNEITDANQLVDQFHAVAIIAGFQSAAIQGLIPTVQGYKVPIVAGGSLLQQSSWGATIYPPDADIADTLIGFMLKDLPKDKSLGNVSGNTPAGLDEQHDVQTYANTHNIQTVQAEIANTATDATPQLQQLASTDAYFSNTSGAINVIQVENAANLGWNKPMIFEEGLVSDCVEMQQKYAGKIYCYSGSFSANHYVREFGMRSTDEKLWKLYKSEGGSKNNVGGVFEAYDQVNLLARAMTAAKSVTDGQKIQNALMHESYTGAYGTYSFKPGYSFGLKGNPWDVSVVSGDQLKFVYAPPAGY